MSLTVTGADLNSHDRRSLEGFLGSPRARRPFDVRGSGVPADRAFGATGFTEVQSTPPARCARPGATLRPCGGDRGREGMTAFRDVLRGLVDNDGITYIRSIGTARRSPTATGWRCSAVAPRRHPLVVSAEDWQTLETGMVQRSRLLDAVWTTSTRRTSVTDQRVLPPKLLFGHPVISARRAASAIPAAISCSCSAAT